MSLTPRFLSSSRQFYLSPCLYCHHTMASCLNYYCMYVLMTCPHPFLSYYTCEWTSQTKITCPRTREKRSYSVRHKGRSGSYLPVQCHLDSLPALGTSDSHLIFILHSVFVYCNPWHEIILHHGYRACIGNVMFVCGAYKNAFVLHKIQILAKDLCDVLRYFLVLWYFMFYNASCNSQIRLIHDSTPWKALIFQFRVLSTWGSICLEDSSLTSAYRTFPVRNLPLLLPLPFPPAPKHSKVSIFQ